MKIFKRILAGVTAAIVFAAMPFSVSAEDKTEDGKKSAVNYGSYSGKVAAITNSGDRTTYTVEKDGEIVANIIANESTYILGADEIKEGDIIEGFFDLNAPMLMIYPPQCTAVVIAVNLPALQSIKIDRFDAEMLSWDEELKLNISDKTEIVLQDGTVYEGELTDRLLAVVYSFAALSIPAQTAPDKIIVLFEKATPVTEAPVEKPAAALNGDIIVNGDKINAPAPYVNAEGVVMVPVRAIAEAMGYKVSWDSATEGVWLNNVISLSLGKDYYTFGRMAPIELGTAPALTDSHTYVPLSFFTNVVRANAVVQDGKVTVDKIETAE